MVGDSSIDRETWRNHTINERTIDRKQNELDSTNHKTKSNKNEHVRKCLDILYFNKISTLWYILILILNYLFNFSFCMWSTPSDSREKKRRTIKGYNSSNKAKN